MFITPLLFAQIADYPPDTVAGIPVNYTESAAGTYTLQDPLVMQNGAPVRDAKTWNTQRRPELVRLFEEHQFGSAPAKPVGLRFDVFDKGTPALDGAAIRRQVTIHLSPTGPKLDLLLYLPAAAKGQRVPVLLNASFTANSNAVDDPGVKPGEIWNTKEQKRVPAATGRRFGRLPVAKFLAAGFGVATVYYGDIDPDFAGGFPHGVRKQYLKPGQTEPAPGEWGTISAWAWGLSRALDFLQSDPGVDARRVALTGVSRLGKTVLWTGARDPRFALIIASCSGEGGAALSRRQYGETIAHLTAPTRYAYQFAANYGKYGAAVDKFPVDAHLLVSLIAPRPLLLQTGNTDKWSDPRGEWLAALAAGPVYRLLGRGDLGTAELPPAGVPLLNTLGYVMHDGGHGMVPGDWDVYIEFMKKHLARADRPER
ncbi:MAG: acetylxylan esterase [Bryobacterales bacterium]|nr:acetylxylan esterase [Bryobacterales bacterium]